MVSGYRMWSLSSLVSRNVKVVPSSVSSSSTGLQEGLVKLCIRGFKQKSTFPVMASDVVGVRNFRGVQSGPAVLESANPSVNLRDNDLSVDSVESDMGEKLYLTPYLKFGRIAEARDLAKVEGLGEMDRILSYSGFLTVNERTQSNIFFWFFPAMNNPETAPVVLWLNGGPGASSMFGLFAGHGPFMVDDQQQLQPRKETWNLNHSVIYIDSPVGTGFSFTEGEEGYATSLNEVVKDLFEALQQFFSLFPDFVENDFYIAGQSYAGKYAPAMAHKIHLENNNKPRVRISLKGIAVGSGLCDPLTQTNYGEYLYNIGLIDDVEKSHFDNSYKEVCQFIKDENWTEAHKILQYLVIGWPRPIVSRFETVTGYSFNSNYLYGDMPERYAYYIPFLQCEYVRKAIHVGDQDFGKMRNKVYEKLSDDFAQSVKPLVEELLNADYKVLFYASQLDVIVPHTGIDKFIRSLKWRGSETYLRVPRNIWKSGSDVAGYSKEAGNLTHLLIRCAGHNAPLDKSKVCFEMMARFTRGVPFF